MQLPCAPVRPKTTPMGRAYPPELAWRVVWAAWSAGFWAPDMPHALKDECSRVAAPDLNAPRAAYSLTLTAHIVRGTVFIRLPLVAQRYVDGPPRRR